MKVFQRKQIVVLVLVLMIIVAGYLQYSYKKSSDSVTDSSKGRLGEAVYVDSSDLDSIFEEDGEIVKKDEDKKDDEDDDKSAIAASEEANSFFASAKLTKEASRSKDTETLKQITQDENAPEEMRTEAYQQMMAMVQNSDREARIETLLKEKGFEDVLALFADDGSIDIVVKAPELSAVQVAQIADIVSRHADLEIEKIHVRNTY